jgi:hypothetical protein
MYVEINTEARSCNHCCSGKAVLHIVSVFVTLGIQHAKHMPRIIMSYSACLALHFSTLSHKRHELKKNVIEHKMYVCFGFLYNFCLKHSFSMNN